MSNLLLPSKTFRPFIYPWAVELDDEHERMHWVKQEIPMGDDLVDWNTDRLTAGEKAFVTQILRMFTQADVAVGGFYHDVLIPKFKNNEIRNMLARFAAREVTHQHAYALVNDTLGLPEGEYAAFLDYKEMSDKYDFMITADNETQRGLGLSLAKAVFNEGVSLFASFAMLLNFQRHGTMKAMGKVVEWSIKDETKHVEGVSTLFRAYCEDFPRIVTDKFKRDIYDMAREVVRLEDAFIDSAFALAGSIKGLTAEDVKTYIRVIADLRLTQLGMKPEFGIAKNPLDWLDWVIGGIRHSNFFESKSAEYEKAGATGDWAYPKLGRKFVVYTKLGCEWCVKVKDLITSKGHTFVEYDLTDDKKRGAFYIVSLVPNRTMPQVFEEMMISPDHMRRDYIGGYIETFELLKEPV